MPLTTKHYARYAPPYGRWNHWPQKSTSHRAAQQGAVARLQRWARPGRRNLVIRKLPLLLSASADRVGLEAPASLDPGGSHAAARAQFGSHGPTDSKRGGSAASRQVPWSVASLRRPPPRVMHARHRVVVHEIDCRVVLSLANACACYTILP